VEFSREMQLEKETKKFALAAETIESWVQSGRPIWSLRSKACKSFVVDVAISRSRENYLTNPSTTLPRSPLV